MKKFVFALAFVLFGLFSVPETIYAVEVINSFHSEISVQIDGSIRVHEIITVVAEGDQIKRGIYRDISTEFSDTNGKVYDVGFKLDKVLQNGLPQVYFTNVINDGIRIYIGDKNTYLSHGTYTYEIYYSVDRILGYHEAHDEIYWNVTGNGWVFPILYASARVTLPVEVPRKQTAIDFYTGPQGSTNKAAQSKTLKDGSIFFEITESLNKNEGLTIVVEWPKNIVIEPAIVYKTTPSPSAKENIPQIPLNIQIIVAVVIFVLYLGYFLFLWHKIGRDPYRHIVIPQFEAPVGMSPAVARFLIRQNYDGKVMGAQLIDLASRGVIDIEKVENQKEYRITKLDTGLKNISDEDRILLENLFSKNKSTLEIDGYATEETDDRRRLRRTDEVLTKHLENLFYGKVIFKNQRQYWRGVLILTPLALLLAIVPMTVGTVSDFVVGVLFVSVFVVAYWLISKMFTFSFKGFVKNAGFLHRLGWAFLKLLQAIIVFFVGPAVYFTAFLVCLGLFVENSAIPNYILLAAIIGVIILFLKIMPRYTEDGARLIEHLEGFKIFLKATEKDRLEFHHPPEKTPELFQKNLGFACALGVEQQWGKQFESAIVAAVGEDGTRTVMRHNKYYAARYFVSDFKTFTSTISSAAISPSNFSGGRGGGSSGGGSKGGVSGGGGW